VGIVCPINTFWCLTPINLLLHLVAACRPFLRLLRAARGGATAATRTGFCFCGGLIFCGHRGKQRHSSRGLRCLLRQFLTGGLLRNLFGRQVGGSSAEK